MNRILSVFTLIGLCACLCCAAFAASDEIKLPDIDLFGGSSSTVESNSSEADKVALPDIPADAIPQPEATVTPETPQSSQSPASAVPSRGSSSGGSSGYASPIVNIEAIEVPLAD